MAVMEVVTMYVFGITGGVGAGKSTVLRLIKENFNASVIEADEVGRMLMEPGNGAYLKIVEIFGEDIQLRYSLESALEILNPEMDKSEGLKLIMELCGIKKEEVIAIGDGENDIGMLKQAALGIAVENACEPLKKIADYISDHNFDRVMFIGDNFSRVKTKYPRFKNLDHLKEYLEKDPVEDSYILLKGSRGVQLEKCIDML